MWFSLRKWWVIKIPVGRVIALLYLSPNRQLLTDESSTPSTAADVAGRLAQIPKSNSTIPQTIVIMSPSGFTPEARDSAAPQRKSNPDPRRPNGAGGGRSPRSRPNPLPTYSIPKPIPKNAGPRLPRGS